MCRERYTLQVPRLDSPPVCPDARQNIFTCWSRVYRSFAGLHEQSKIILIFKWTLLSWNIELSVDSGKNEANKKIC